jgi:hypothetical protein
MTKLHRRSHAAKDDEVRKKGRSQLNHIHTMNSSNRDCMGRSVVLRSSRAHSVHGRAAPEGQESSRENPAEINFSTRDTAMSC